MFTTQELLTQARSAQGIPSNYRLAKVLGITEHAVSSWQNGRRVPDDTMAVRLAEMAGLPPGQVLASMHAQREPEGSPVRAAWQSLCIMSTKARRALGGRRLAFA